MTTTGQNNRRISDILAEVEAKKLVLQPYFQRRLVWTNVVKDKFLETVLKGLPFPEIFIATGELNRHTLERVNWLVDGQQRISTLREYVNGSKDLVVKLVKPYNDLSPDEQTQFLDYFVAVRDLGSVTFEEIKEIFSRINSTDYALKRMEKMNALYSGAYKSFCEELSINSFFNSHDVFSLADRRRMSDLNFCVILVSTILSTYYHRDDLNEEYLGRYNDDFSKKDRINSQLAKVFSFIEKCNFDEQSRVWKKTDLFTILVEVHSALIVKRLPIDPNVVGKRIKAFYAEVDKLYDTKAATNEQTVKAENNDVMIYLKAAIKAANDKYARVDRAKIIGSILESTLSPASKGESKPLRKRSKLC
jgi:hypothetical protein